MMIADLQEAIRVARHDLGKYASLNTRWLPENYSAEELRAALVLDLRQTFSFGGRVEGVGEVWARVRGGLVGLELGEIEIRVARLVSGAGELEKLERRELEELAGLARELGAALKRL